MRLFPKQHYFEMIIIVFKNIGYPINMVILINTFTEINIVGAGLVPA
jgi:hypothetical protein